MLKGKQSYVEEIQQGHNFVTMKIQPIFHLFIAINYFE